MSNVIQLENLRITLRRESHRQPDACQHHNLTFDGNGEIVECDDCGKQVSAFWALTMLASEYEQAMNKLLRAKQQFQEAKAKDVGLLAAQKVERAWRSRSMVPSCPHCHEAIFPQDDFGGSMVNREIAIRRRSAAITQGAPHDR